MLTESLNRVNTHVCNCDLPASTLQCVFPLRLGGAWLYYGIVLLTTTFLQYDPHCRKSAALPSLCWFVKPVVPAYRYVFVQSLFSLLYLVPIGSVWMCCLTVVITSELVRGYFPCMNWFQLECLLQESKLCWNAKCSPWFAIHVHDDCITSKQHAYPLSI